MIVKLFGLLDLIAAAMFLFLNFGLGVNMGYFFAGYLIIKGMLFFQSFVSFLDIAAGVFLFLAVFGNFNVFSWVFSLWLLQKGVFSMIA